MELIRAFFAIPIPSEAKLQIKKFLTPLENLKNIRFIPDENWHLTIKFIGNIRVDQIQELVKKVEDQLSQIDCSFINLNLTRIAGFPEDQAKLIAAYVENTETLNTLAEMVESVICDLGFPKEKHVFTPHITLARSKFRRIPVFSEISLNGIIKDANELIFFESRPARQGSEYIALKKILLK